MTPHETATTATRTRIARGAAALRLAASLAFTVLLLGAVVAQEGGDWQALGGETYANCAGCHQSDGAGLPGVFPPLVGHVVHLYEADRDYLPQVLLYGLQGEIEVEGQSYNGVMPAWAQLTDEQIAAVLNHTLTAFGDPEELPEDFTPYAPADVAELRAAGLDAAAMLELRGGLELHDHE